jgi:large subunit ribosomal protein L9
MSKKQTEVILTSHVVSLGKSEGDMVSVAPGYARNYLLPHGLAIPSSPGNQRRIASLQVQKVEREATELQHMTELRDSLKSLKLVIKVKTGEGGKLFGSVTAGTICDELKNQFDVDLDKRKVSLDKAIKEIGEYDVPLKLHVDIEAQLNVIVESEIPVEVVADEEAEPAAAE